MIKNSAITSRAKILDHFKTH